jgi:UDP-N-acetyl-D-mannosaminuronic acid dehydrogenase
VATQVSSADVFIIAVPTPLNDDKSPDLSAVEAAFDSIAPHLKQNDLIILESTCPVGATADMVERLDAQRPDLSEKVYVAYCPERVLPGQILKELVENDRIVGGITPACTQQAIAFYQSFVKGECFPTDSKTAELCKLTENSFRDVNIAFANEISIICDQQGVDVWQLIKLANRHPRVNVLQPGCGVGGHCIAIDPWFIVNQAPESTQLLQAARVVNDSKTHWVLQKIHEAVSTHQTEHGSTPQIACLGITFKANIDDVRESPALEIVASLAEKYPNHVLVVEPNLKMLPTALQNKAIHHVNLDQASQEADLLVLLVEHNEFKKPPVNSDKKQTVLDFKGLWSTQ